VCFILVAISFDASINATQTTIDASFDLVSNLFGGAANAI
jgi:hypothetical protein